MEKGRSTLSQTASLSPWIARCRGCWRCSSPWGKGCYVRLSRLLRLAIVSCRPTCPAQTARDSIGLAAPSGKPPHEPAFGVSERSPVRMSNLSAEIPSSLTILTKFFAATGAPGLAHLWKISASLSSSCSEAGAKLDVGARVTIRHMTICKDRSRRVNNHDPPNEKKGNLPRLTVQSTKATRTFPPRKAPSYESPSKPLSASMQIGR